MAISREAHDKLKRLFKSMEEERFPWFSWWRELADFIMPRRYLPLWEGARSGTGQRPHATLRNPHILDGTGTMAARTLAAGMMDGITSPARPWFRMRAANDFENGPVREWLDEVRARMMYLMAETNFYNAMAVFYIDLVVFATGSMLIYDDDDDVFRCYNVALGEYYIAQDNKKKVSRFARRFEWRVEQIVDEFGLENCSKKVKQDWTKGGESLNNKHVIVHLIEPNRQDDRAVAPIHQYREFYWLEAAPGGELLRHAGFRESPNITARWETTGNDSYGTGPSADGLPDIKQLQHMTKRRAQGLDKMISPPILADIQLQNRPMALLPNGVTFVSGASQIGAKPVYEVNVPLAEMDISIQAIQTRIRQLFHNDLFTMISQLDTVRSATEIDARREEKLVLLGPVLERFENEGLDPALNRIFQIGLRKGLFPPVPPELVDQNIQVEYISVLSDAQRAVGAIPIERYLTLIGSISGVKQEVLDIPQWDELIFTYADAIGVPPKVNKSRDEVLRLFAQRAQGEGLAGMSEVLPGIAQGAKNLSETEVGGGANALQLMMGG